MSHYAYRLARPVWHKFCYLQQSAVKKLLWSCPCAAQKCVIIQTLYFASVSTKHATRSTFYSKGSTRTLDKEMTNRQWDWPFFWGETARRFALIHFNKFSLEEDCSSIIGACVESFSASHSNIQLNRTIFTFTKSHLVCTRRCGNRWINQLIWFQFCRLG